MVAVIQVEISTDGHTEYEASKDTKEDTVIEKSVCEQLFCQCRNFRKWFTWNDLFVGLISLSVNGLDVGTDFNLAHELNMDGETNKTSQVIVKIPFVGVVHTNIRAQFASFTYFFISLPGVILAAKTFFGQVKTICQKLSGVCDALTPCWKCNLFLNLVAFVLTIVAMEMALTLATAAIQKPLFLLAVASAFYTIMVSLARVFLHSDEMKRLAIRTSVAEEQYESAFQIHLFFLSWLNWPLPQGHQGVLWLGQVISIITVGKAGAVGLVAMEEETLESEKPLKTLLKWSKLIPVFCMTAIFRMGSYAVMISWSYRQSTDYLWIFTTLHRDIMFVLLLPVFVLFILQLKISMLKPLTAMDIVQVRYIWSTAYYCNKLLHTLHMRKGPSPREP